jgi:hypothetical protein
MIVAEGHRLKQRIGGAIVSHMGRVTYGVRVVLGSESILGGSAVAPKRFRPSWIDALPAGLIPQTYDMTPAHAPINVDPDTRSPTRTLRAQR